MIRRRSLLAALAAVGLTACGTFSNNDAAADVDGTEVSREDYEQLIGGLTSGTAPSVQTDAATGTLDAPTGRQLLDFLIVNAASASLISAAGEAVTDDDRAAARDTLDAGGQADQFAPEVVDVLVEREASRAALARVAAADDLEVRYNESPAEVGVLCVRHILVATEEEAVAVVEELDAGADFAELAAERSIDAGSAANGGALELQAGQPCLPLEQAEASLDTTFVTAAETAVPGTPTAPVETTFGWHVILARPFDEVGDAVASIAGDQLLDDHLAIVPVTVDPRYGRWDPETLTVVEL